MDKVGKVTSPFKDQIEVKMRSTSSKEARQYSVDASCVIVGGSVRLTVDFEEKQLEQVIINSLNKC